VVKRAKKRNFIIKSSSKSVNDKRGILREIEFVHIYKVGNFLTNQIEKGKITKYRLFIKDYDGSICEIP